MKMSDYPKACDHPVVSCEVKDKVATLTLCAPDNQNMINKQFVHEFHDAILDLRYDDQVRVIVLVAEGETFFGPGDAANLIFSRLMQNELLARQFMQENLAAQREMKNCGKPIIACMDAISIGGGCGWTLAADIVFATQKAGVAPGAHVISGMIPDCGGVYALARLAGPQKAMWWALRPDPVLAQEAYDNGLITKLFDDKESMMAEAYKLAEHLASVPPYGVQGVKTIGNHYTDWDFETYAMYEAENVANAVHTKDFQASAAIQGAAAEELAAKGEAFSLDYLMQRVMEKTTSNDYVGY